MIELKPDIHPKKTGEARTKQSGVLRSLRTEDFVLLLQYKARPAPGPIGLIDVNNQVAIIEPCFPCGSPSGAGLFPVAPEGCNLLTQTGNSRGISTGDGNGESKFQLFQLMVVLAAAWQGTAR